MCTRVEKVQIQSSEKTCTECANDVEANMDWVWKRDLSSILSKSLGLIIDTLVEYLWTDPTSFLSHWDGLLIQFLLSCVQIIILCPCAVVLHARTIFFCDLATVCDHTIILGTYETVFHAPTYFQLCAHPKIRHIALSRLDDCIARVLGCATRMVLMPGSMLECCCVVVLAPLKVTKPSEDFQKMLHLLQTVKSLRLYFTSSCTIWQPNDGINGRPRRLEMYLDYRYLKH